jgi:hypothetical protein
MLHRDCFDVHRYCGAISYTIGTQDSTKGNYCMAKRKKRRQRILWTAAHEKQLRRLSGRTPAAKIARTLSRSEAAVRYKAHTLGLSLAVKRR